jgi:phage-related protein
LHEVLATEDPSRVSCEHIDAMDSGGSWYQAFVIARNENGIRVHFNGWEFKVFPA